MIIVIDYGMGNLRSVEKALQKINAKFKVSSDKDDLERATHIILPGVGNFKEGMKNLQDLGFLEALHKEVIIKRKPFLGICLGMQLLFDRSEESGSTKGLSFIDGEIVRFTFGDKTKLKVPHIGWNNVSSGESRITIMDEIEDNCNFYFVHSYHATLKKEEAHNTVYAITNYGYDFISAIQKENIFGTQFHPEKSQKKGLKILENFTKLRMAQSDIGEL